MDIFDGVPIDVVANDFLIHFPEFGESDPLVIQAQLSQLCMYFRKSRWGAYESVDCPYTTLKGGVYNLLAHTLFMRREAIKASDYGIVPQSVRGMDSSSVGDESVTYGTQMFLKMRPWDDALASTPYGVEYLRLRYYVGAGPVTV